MKIKLIHKSEDTQQIMLLSKIQERKTTKKKWRDKKNLKESSNVAWRQVRSWNIEIIGVSNGKPSKGTAQILQIIITKRQRGLKLRSKKTHCTPGNTDPEELTPAMFGKIFRLYKKQVKLWVYRQKEKVTYKKKN